MKMYCIDRGSTVISEIDVESETPQFAKLSDGTKLRKHSSWSDIYATRESALAVISARLQARVERARVNLKHAEDELAAFVRDADGPK
jgi:hypothetical protein